MGTTLGITPGITGCHMGYHMTRFRFGPMTVKLQYCRKKGDLLFFRRRVPLDLRNQVGRDFFVQSLGTSDPREAARKIAKLVKETDSLWSAMRKPSRKGNLLLAHEILEEHGLDPVQLPAPIPVSYEDFLEETLGTTEVIPEPHRTALDLLSGSREFTIDDTLTEYVAARPSDSVRAKRAFRYLTEYLKGDRPITRVRRTDVNGFVQHLLGKEMSTTTVQRYLTPIKAAFARIIREREMKIENVFAKPEIPNFGKDVVAREVFTLDDFRALDAALFKHEPDSLRSILLIVSETGARLAEIAGLVKSDVKLLDPTPHIILQSHPWRTIKTDETRKVPLTERAQESLRGAMGRSHDPAFIFPHYTDYEGCNAGAVSKALVKWIRTRPGLQGTKLGNHSMRHGIKDLLRMVNCPGEAQDQIVGHRTPGMGAHYGQGYPLEMLADWLKQACAKKHR